MGSIRKSLSGLTDIVIRSLRGLKDIGLWSLGGIKKVARESFVFELLRFTRDNWKLLLFDAVVVLCFMAAVYVILYSIVEKG